MDTLIDEVTRDFNLPVAVTYLDLIFALVTSFILSLVLAKTYIATHVGYSYSRTFVISMVLVSISISLIMIIIGSNIARAFALVGAMSIVRFRNPVKDSRDLVFIFMCIAVGMACGTKFYGFGVIFTLFAVFIIFLLDYLDFGNIESSTYVLRVKLPPSERAAMDYVCKEMCDKFFVVSTDVLAGERDIEEVVYEVHLKKGREYKDLLKAIGESSNNISASLLVGESNVAV